MDFERKMSKAETKDAPAKPKRKNYPKDSEMCKTQIQTNEGQFLKQSDWKAYLSSGTCIQITAWLLLTVGLCIIVSTIYMGILMRKSVEGSFSEDYENITYNTFTSIETTTIGIMLNKSVRTLSAPEITEDRGEGCREYNCKVLCIRTNAYILYESIYNTIKASSCQAIESLVIKEQTLPLGLLRNGWHDFSRPLYELDLRDSYITHIRSGAFNSPLFAETHLLSLNQLNLKSVGGGALLGFKSLRYLIIHTNLNEINRAFFQPVQSTLLHLRINSGLIVSSGQTIFGVSMLKKLEFADLSRNVFIGPLTRQMFLATPNLHYLHIVGSQISAIDGDAFEDLESLQVLDLSDNYLTTISMSSLKPLLWGRTHTLVSLAYNKWNCECNLLEFVQIYRIFRHRFLGTLYCHSPYRLNGELLYEIKFANNECSATTTNFELADTTVTPRTSKTIKAGTTTTLTQTVPDISVIKATTLAPDNWDDTKTTVHDGFNSSSRKSSEDLGVIQLRCLQASLTNVTNDRKLTRDKRAVEIIIQSTESTDSQDNSAESNKSSDESSGSEESDESLTNTLNSRPMELITKNPINPPHSMDDATTTRSRITNRWRSNVAFYEFEVPSYMFELILLPNNSVKVVIKDYNGQPLVNVVWFSQQNDTAAVHSEAAQNIDYHCEMYQEPYLIANDLKKNCTYTFCMLPSQSYAISPFNCQPMYVPSNAHGDDETWISAEEKQFTISMLCIIFTVSTFFGGIIAYFGIKTYPELLEGSKNVLVVKSSEPETDYLKNMDSLKKQPLSRCSTRKLTPSLPETPPLSLPPPPPPPPFSVSTYDLERLSSVKSSSTFFESSFASSPFAVIDDQYELPKQYNHNIDEERCVPNTYAKSPCSPPPLPKRNLSITSISANGGTKAD